MGFERWENIRPRATAALGRDGTGPDDVRSRGRPEVVGKRLNDEIDLVWRLPVSWNVHLPCAATGRCHIVAR